MSADARPPAPVWRSAAAAELEARADALDARFAAAEPAEILRAALVELFPGRIAIVSSFGSESALLLALAAEIDPATPVLTLDTQKLFPETLAYRDRLAAHLGLTDLRTVEPKPEDLAADDPSGDLHARKPDLCCHIRKTLPLVRALRGLEAWVTGRKRYQGGARAALPTFEIDGGRIKVNPLARMSAGEVAAEIGRRGLPRHPLVAAGYPSIGCRPCTTPAAPDEDARAGRWRGEDKTECGIHLGADGRFVRDA